MAEKSSFQPGQIIDGQIAGYLGVQTEKVAESYNAGFSMYVAAWPLVVKYPGNEFQTGLFGTWMHQQFQGPAPERKLYCDIEGGLGWWRDTRFATETPKFIMGGVALGFSQWANGPGAGKNRDWDHPLGLYGAAQLSRHVLWPPDGLNVKQGTCGQLWGYGYLNLPLLNPKSTTSGKNVPTGGNCWTLFLNTGNFKGPVAFFTPFFFSSVVAEQPELAGLFLDTLPGLPNRHIQMETQHIPAKQSVDNQGDTYARIEATRFPRGPQGEAVMLHQATVYDKNALWDDVHRWLNEDGKPVGEAFNPQGAALHKVIGESRLSWAIYVGDIPRDQRVPLAWKSIAQGGPLDTYTYGYRWSEHLVTRTNTAEGSLTTLPEYFRLDPIAEGGAKWIAVPADQVPTETGLAEVTFIPKVQEPMEPYVTPDAQDSCWKKPGPKAGPFKARLGDGSTVVYYWYRFADQPALLNADLTDGEREDLQVRVEKLHERWKPDHDYMAPPGIGELADIDPALLVEPPAGLEIGYVPIATWQGIEK